MRPELSCSLAGGDDALQGSGETGANTGADTHADLLAQTTRPPAGRAALPRQRGFTLIEVLVVITIVGIVLAGVSIGFERFAGRNTQLALERLRWVLEASAERAQIRGQPIAFELLSDGYRFSTLNTDGKWIAFEEAPLFVEKILPEPLLWGGLRLDKSDANPPARRIVFGTRTPRFELLVQTADGLARLQGIPTGAVTLQLEH